MSKAQKIFTWLLWAGAMVTIAGVLALRSLPGDRPAASVLAPPVESSVPVLYDAPAFSLTDQNNQTVTNASLAGHLWVADFVFTTCTTECPLISQHMAKLQSLLPAEVKLVSFTVDPEHDTPAVMAKYLQNLHAEAGRWMMLTSDVANQSKVVEGMKLHFAPASGGQAIVHDTRFVLVDGQGRIRGYYDSDEPGKLNQLLHDVGLLTGKPVGSWK